MPSKPLNFIASYHSSNLVSQAIAHMSAGKATALVTLVNIEGNAPYPIGSQMLVTATGDYIGQITGGCAEQAIADQAVNAISIGKNSIQRYGLNSPYFDIKLPCGSGIDVHFETQISLEQLSEIQKALLKREVVSINFGDYIKEYTPSPRILIFGQGPIVVKLAQLALLAGFDVCCVAQNSDTASLLEAESLEYKELDLILAESDKELTESLDEFTAFVSLFHEHELETNLLLKALRSNSFYIGALGSKNTHEKRKLSLVNQGVSEEGLKKIHGPVGLNIGANTPAQIALSILAEVTAELNDK